MPDGFCRASIHIHLCNNIDVDLSVLIFAESVLLEHCFDLIHCNFESLAFSICDNNSGFSTGIVHSIVRFADSFLTFIADGTVNNTQPGQFFI
jgi:hypothetical protein